MALDGPGSWNDSTKLFKIHREPSMAPKWNESNESIPGKAEIGANLILTFQVHRPRDQQHHLGSTLEAYISNESRRLAISNSRHKNNYDLSVWLIDRKLKVWY